MGKSMLRAVLATLLISAGVTATAQVVDADDSKDIKGLDLEDLLNMKTSVATKKELSSREAPGIVTVITNDEIRKSGARDLDDILTVYVPGFQLNTDVEVATGPAMRGIYAIEGKILLLIDGIEANDDVWGNILFGNHYPADIIDHIEVIRGPGSAIYGNYASLGVISVTTKGASANSANFVALNSQMSKAADHQNFVGGFGKEFNKDFSASFYFNTGSGTRTDSDYSNFFFSPQTVPTSFPGADHFTDRPQMFNANVKYKGFDFRAIVDLFQQGYPIQATPENISTDIEYSYLYDLKYEYKVSDKLKIIPQLSYNIHKPYNVEIQNADPAQNFSSDVIENHRDSRRYFYGILSQWDPNKDLNIVSGVEYYKTEIYIGDGWDHKTNSQNGSNFPQAFAKFPGSSYANENYAAYSQGTWSNPIANITLGARYEKTWRFGDAFVPRAGLTKVIGNFHSKFMLTKSFRTPLGIQTDKATGDISPEKALNTELEVGYRLSPELLIQGNLFDIQLNDLIMYQAAIGAAQSTYANVGTQRTQGAEAELRYISKKTSVTANYAFYKNLTHAPTNDVPQDHQANVGLPQHRFNLIGGYKFNDRVSIHPIAEYVGNTYAWTWTDYNTTPPTGTIGSLDPNWYFHLNMRFHDIVTKGLDLDVGGHNLGNAGGFLPQAYAGYTNAQPVESRSWMFRLGYTKEI